MISGTKSWATELSASRGRVSLSMGVLPLRRRKGMAPTEGHGTDKALGPEKNTNQRKKSRRGRDRARKLGTKPGYMQDPSRIIDLVVELVKASMKLEGIRKTSV